MCWQDVYLETERLEEEKNRYTPFFLNPCIQSGNLLSSDYRITTALFAFLALKEK